MYLGKKQEAMKTKTIGTTKLKTPPIMFGGNVFGWTLDKKASFRMLDMLFERGYTFIDTANTYGRKVGHSESIIGEWMKKRGNRHQINLATKAGRVHEQQADGKVRKSVNNARTYLTDCAHESLKRLQTDYIDLFYTHFDDNYTPMAEVLEAYYRLVQDGKIKYIGASNHSDVRLKQALTQAKGTSFPKYEVFQTEYNLMERREFEKKFKEICYDYHVSVTTYFSLASGFLTGKYRKKEDFMGTARQALTEKYLTPKGKRVLEVLDEISEEHHTSNAAVSLAWILHRPHITACIASATKESHLDAFDQALDLKLSKNEIHRLNEVSAY